MSTTKYNVYVISESIIGTQTLAWYWGLEHSIIGTLKSIMRVPLYVALGQVNLICCFSSVPASTLLQLSLLLFTWGTPTNYSINWGTPLINSCDTRFAGRAILSCAVSVLLILRIGEIMNNECT